MNKTTWKIALVSFVLVCDSKKWLITRNKPLVMNDSMIRPPLKWTKLPVPPSSYFLRKTLRWTKNQKWRVVYSLRRAFQDTRPTFNHQSRQGSCNLSSRHKNSVTQVGRSFSNHSTDENSPALHDIYLKSETRVICMHRNVLGGEAIAAWWSHSFIRNLERETTDEAPQTSEFW